MACSLRGKISPFISTAILPFTPRSSTRIKTVVPSSTLRVLPLTNISIVQGSEIDDEPFASYVALHTRATFADYLQAILENRVYLLVRIDRIMVI